MRTVVILRLLFTTAITLIAAEPASENTKNVVVTPKIYANIFIRRREEHKIFVKHLINSNYEKTYKMLDLAFEKILELVEEHNMTLHQSGYDPAVGFPTEGRLQDAVTLIIENVCLAGDLVLHFPEIAYRVLKKRTNWKDTFNWGTEFLQFYSPILTEQTNKMIGLFRQEINLSERSENFVNPYYAKEKSPSNKKDKKTTRKKLKKGPQLTRRSEL